MKKKLPVFDFQLGNKEKDFVNDCLKTSFIGQGSYVNEFEKSFSFFSKLTKKRIFMSLPATRKLTIL